MLITILHWTRKFKSTTLLRNCLFHKFISMKSSILALINFLQFHEKNSLVNTLFSYCIWKCGLSNGHFTPRLDQGTYWIFLKVVIGWETCSDLSGFYTFAKAHVIPHGYMVKVGNVMMFSRNFFFLSIALR